jgi:AbrB family looped-hinge helix DNA binding protein
MGYGKPNVMTGTVTISSKYQLYIPKHIRNELDLNKTTKAKISVTGNKIVIEPMKNTSIENLAFKLEKYTKDKNIDIDNIRKYIEWSNV